MQTKMSILVATIVAVGVTVALPAQPGGVKLDLWDNVMSKHVRPGSQMGISINIVDYIGIAKDPDFTTFTNSLADAFTSNLTQNESFAIGINMYNAYAIKTLIDFSCKYDDNLNQKGACYGPAYGLPDISVKMDGATVAGFDIPYHAFAGKNYSLNDIEGMMRPLPAKPLFNEHVKEDLRIHACLVCDGTSCPDLSNQAFLPETIDAQMSAAVTGWMANPWKGLRIFKSNNTVYFSRIMSWFEDEFEAQGGVVKAYSDYLPANAKAYFDSTTKYTQEFFEYIWDSNGPNPCSCLPDVEDEALPLPGCHLKP